MMKITNRRAMALLAAGLLLPTLAGCSRSSEDPPVPVENDTPVVEENMTVPDETPVMTNDSETVAPVNMAADTIPPPPPERTVDQQMLDDASATGMTARVQRTPNSDAPAEGVEPKDAQ
ncbi:hypothetical protein [Sphingomonas fuzhouensis]|uniref:hypothetical protein n=1 Tax=Sphingomonas fuzhouensis TaxID=3106033 RepID=UPI002AFEAEBA|nr:hypothetical protein [Sphingomonas sp. SGZ-02]